MSLLHRGTEVVTVFPEEVTTDPDGNVRTRPSATGIVCKAVVQPVGTPTEDQDTGFRIQTKYRLRLVNWPGPMLGAQSQVEWNGKRYSVDGEPRIYNGSRRTAHVDYVILQS
ncbi:hypothetical protein [Mycolicibacterium smegmatis]|uniref:hypothetical protein n=1 Tax=Mycolicibacterium smegmatis TaxID=1772 RepID=UPI0013033882|nr:hypothetical protein [Mycolicibacterium smegmatis]